ncbi:nucleotide disphospho-sugar-binding domain-containing protein [Micromonospora endolithica]|uniref:DUF1205 domain-containing protein n=1 Tax=Micromonospora endolithica TaxID=230091 RepID=A0A3A9ZS32_9ACTN|nr:nucleotide disphospho-sugar-binding domain-containing protein [Micromonospora endolithica]RKN50257.1 DUF1205 domain-containing protein [Micromonospora endolithica]TWJ21101.1 UDP:flavonoid glycosyltransferase YjiC (YdhE family) [Micromonospora endolithica]
MRVLFTPMAWPTHYYQMVGLVWAFRAAGHDVRVAAQPALLPAVTSTGGIGVQVGGGYDLMEGVADLVKVRKSVDQGPNMVGPGEFHADVRARLLELRMVPHIKTAEDMAEDLVTFAQAWRPDLVVTDPLCYAAPLAAAAVGAPVVRHLWGPDMSRHVGLPGTGTGPEEDPRAAWPQGLVDVYERYGVKPSADIADVTVDTCPPSLQLPGVPNRMPMRYTAYNGPAIAPSWVLDEPDRPRILVTWSSSWQALMTDEAFLVPRILEALRPVDAEVVVAVRAHDRARVPETTGDVRVVEDMPLNLLLPTCRAIVHQSGSGAALTAALYGVPHLALPQVADEGLVCDQIVASGVGVGLKADEADTGAITTAAASLLSEEKFTIAARRIRDELLAQPSPADVVRSLEKLR